VCALTFDRLRSWVITATLTFVGHGLCDIIAIFDNKNQGALLLQIKIMDHYWFTFAGQGSLAVFKITSDQDHQIFCWAGNLEKKPSHILYYKQSVPCVLCRPIYISLACMGRTFCM